MSSSEIDTRDDSPFPSASMMDLDMMRAGAVLPELSQRVEHSRRIEGVGETVVAMVYGIEKNDLQRDQLCRRMEMMGDLFETLRRAAEKMAAAGLEVSEEHAVLSAFCVPKPFGRE